MSSEHISQVEFKNMEGIDYVSTLTDKSVHLILADPPYIISKDSGMNKFNKAVKKIDKDGKNLKTEGEWQIFKASKGYTDDIYKNNYLKYGNASGKKYSYKTDFGEWDRKFTIDKLEEFVKLFYKKLVKGGTCIIFFDLWKIGILREIMEKYKFKQIRLIEWIKTNPIPLNQSVNYLTNAREVAVLGIKVSKPTFNSKYDKGIYDFPIQTGKMRCHPTQKNKKMFKALIKKHSNEGDVVLDPFLGGGTTLFACKETNRNFKGCEVVKEYYDKVMALCNA